MQLLSILKFYPRSGHSNRYGKAVSVVLCPIHSSVLIPNPVEGSPNSPETVFLKRNGRGSALFCVRSGVLAEGPRTCTRGPQHPCELDRASVNPYNTAKREAA